MLALSRIIFACRVDCCGDAGRPKPPPTCQAAQRLAAIVARCCEIKADVVGQDETESGLRAILNFGHTIGHAIEAISGYGKYLHGEAISIGQIAAARLSAALTGLPTNDVTRIMGANSQRAAEVQEATTPLVYKVFDILRHKGRDLRGVAAVERRQGGQGKQLERHGRMRGESGAAKVEQYHRALFAVSCEKWSNRPLTPGKGIG